MEVVDKFRIFATKIKNSSINPESKARIMINRLLNLKTTQKITLILTTLLLLPSVAMATIYDTTGKQVKSMTNVGNANVHYGWDVNNGNKWSISYESGDVSITGGATTLQFTLNAGKTMTLSTSKPTNESGDFRKISLVGLNENLSTTISFGSENLSSISTEVFAPESPIKWESQEITITITNNQSENISCTINSISFLTGTQSSEEFSWGELTPGDYSDIDGLSKTINGSNTSIEGHCEAGTMFNLPLTSSNSITINYFSSNPEVADVIKDMGTVTIKSAGEATITAIPQETDDNTYYSPSSYSYNINITAIDEYYGLTVAGKRVTSGNATNITSEDITEGKISYNNNILTLNGVKTSSLTEGPFIFYDESSNHTIKIQNTNVINGYITSEGGTLNIQKGSESSSLEMIGSNDTEGPICYFSSITLDDGLYINCYSYDDAKQDYSYLPEAYYDNGGFRHPLNYVDRIIISSNKPTISNPSIWIGSVEVNENGTFNDYNAEQVSFNSSTKTLTLSGAILYYDIVSSYPELNILLKENKNIPTTMSTSTKIISTNPDATLSFSSENGGYLSTSLGNGRIPWEGFANDTKPTFNNGLVYLANGDCQFIRVLPAPTISMDESSVSVTGLGDGYGNYFNYFYSINYEDGEGNVSKTEEPLEPESVEVLNIPVTVKPFTISVSAAYTDQFGNKAESAETIGKYFGFAESELTVPYQASVNAPSIVPTLPDGVTVTYSKIVEPDSPGPSNDYQIDATGKITIDAPTETSPAYMATFPVPENTSFEILNQSSLVSDVTKYFINPFTLTVTKKPLKDVTIEDIPDQPFTGDAITPEVVIKNGDLPITDDDCEIAYSDNTNVGTATVTITPTETSYYSGSATKTFKITALSIADATVTLESGTEFTYNEAKNVPTIESVILTIGTSTPDKPAPTISLTAETDYTISYTKGGEAIDADNVINAGTYKMVLTGKGNFTGTKEVEFTISPRAIESMTFSLSATDFTYNAQAQKPTVTLQFDNGGTAKTIPTTNYDVTYSGDCINVGTYSVSATLKGNYSGSADGPSFTISQAAISAVTLEKTQLSWTGEEQTVDVASVKAGDVDVPSSDYTVSGNKGKEPGTYTVTVTATGSNFKGSATATFVIDGGYMLWVGNTLVTPDNKDDVLGDKGETQDGRERETGSFIYNPENNTLLVIHSDAELAIESRLPKLFIHLTGENKLKKVTFNNQGNTDNTGELLFTCDSNFPGTAIIKNTAGESAITGFSSVDYEFDLRPIAPAKAKYTNGQMTDSLGVVTDSLTIGVPLTPLTGDEPEILNPDDFTVTNPDGSTATIDLSGAAVNNIYYTLPESTDGQGYDAESNTISVIDPMTDAAVEEIAKQTMEKSTSVGSEEYAENFVGMTFIVQGGEGVIKIIQEVVEGYEFHLKIGDDPSIVVGEGQTGDVTIEVPYKLDDATYCWLYLVKKASGSRILDGTRVGKRDRAHGTIYSVNIKVKAVASSKSATQASGGTVTPQENLTITGIVEIKNDTPNSNTTAAKTDDRWYSIDGRRIDKPTQKGIYIRNRKKIVIK